MELDELKQRMACRLNNGMTETVVTDKEETNEKQKGLAELAGLALAECLYQERVLTRYFINEGWTEQSAVELARRMIERGSYLPAQEHVKYLNILNGSRHEKQKYTSERMATR